MRSTRYSSVMAATTRLLLVVMLPIFSGCQSTHTTRLTMTAPPPPESELRIVGITTRSGQEVEFSEPGRIESREQLDQAILRAAVATVYDGRPASRWIEIPLADVEEFHVEHDERKFSLGRAFLGLAFLVGIGLAIKALVPACFPLCDLDLFGTL